jgi:hypothetical protein
MRAKGQVWSAVVLALIAWSPAVSQNIDKALLSDILVEESLKYVDSRLEFDFSIDGSQNDERSVQVRLRGEWGIDLQVEKGWTGRWIKAGTEISYDYSETKNATETESTQRAYTVRGFEDYYPLSVGYKLYFGAQSPFFLYTEGQGRWEKGDNVPSEADDPETSAGLGIGYGRVIDIGSFQRVMIVQDELMFGGLLTRRFPRSVTAQLIPLFRRSGDHAERIREVEAILVSNGLIVADDISLDISYEIFDAIRSSFDKRKYGLEVKAAYVQELTTTDPDLEKHGYLTAQLLWEYPVSRGSQVATLADLRERTGSDEFGSYSLELKLRNVHGRYVESELGLLGRYERWKGDLGDTSRTFGELFGEVSYEITDVVDWTTRLETTRDEYEDDKQIGYAVTSQIAYQLY